MSRCVQCGGLVVWDADNETVCTTCAHRTYPPPVPVAHTGEPPPAIPFASLLAELPPSFEVQTFYRPFRSTHPETGFAYFVEALRGAGYEVRDIPMGKKSGKTVTKATRLA